MIARNQKTKVLGQLITRRLLGGRFAYIRDVIPDVIEFFKGKSLGGPLASLRPAIKGQPIGGPKGTDIADTLNEFRDDLDLLYSSIIELVSRNIDLYEIFSVRKDRLTLKAQHLRYDIGTLLAQQGAVSRDSFTESFHQADNIDLSQTTAAVLLDEGIVTLPVDNTRSVKYDGTKVKVVKTILPAGAVQPGPSFDTVFSPYRLDAWYATIKLGDIFEAQINITGLDSQKGMNETVLINGIKIEPTGPINVEISWSVDGFNWSNLNPAANATIRDVKAFHFDPINLGFLRFRVKHSEEILDKRSLFRSIGIKRIEILKRGFNPTASFYSKELPFSDTVQGVVPEIEADIPLGTRVVPYVSLASNGPWTPLQAGAPVTFDNQVWVTLPINQVQEEQPGVPQTMWRTAVSQSQPPLPNTGELIAGRDQVQISAYLFDWQQKGDPNHIPDIADWRSPLAEVRTRVFAPIAGIGAVSGITNSSFSDNLSPLAFDGTTSDSYMVLALVDGNGKFSLQPGYNYRVLSYVWAEVPTTLQGQKIAVINTGGTAGTKVAPLSLYVNGVKVFQNQTAATAISDLSQSQYQATVPLVQGLNEIQLLIQVPITLAINSSGLAGTNVFLYFQPNVFSTNLQNDLNITYIQAYKDLWPRISEFNLRYNTPPAIRSAWAWDEDISNSLNAGNIQYALFNHDPTNTAPATGFLTPQSYQTIDGVNAGDPTNLFIRYPTERNVNNPTRSLFFRVDLFQDEGASAPPVLHSYRLIVN